MELENAQRHSDFQHELVPEYNPTVPPAAPGSESLEIDAADLEGPSFSKYESEREQNLPIQSIFCKKTDEVLGRRRYYTFTNTSDPTITAITFQSRGETYVNIQNVTLPLEDFLGFKDAVAFLEDRCYQPNLQLRPDVTLMDNTSVKFTCKSGKEYIIQSLKMDFFLVIVSELAKEEQGTPIPHENPQGFEELIQGQAVVEQQPSLLKRFLTWALLYVS